MLQRMTLSLLKVITPINRIKPSIQEELSPLPIPHHKATRRQPIFILCNDEIYSVAFQVAERFDDAVRRHDGGVGNHVGFEFGGCEQVGVDGESGVHDEGCSVEVPEEG